jgi:chemotaxis protein CheD
MNFKLISVGIADLKVTSTPDILRTILGSCVGICCYDYEKKIAGLSHIMLPTMNENASNEKKYADSAIPLLIAEMERAGANVERITAKIAGGASMFKLIGNGIMSEIGKNNVAKVREVLTGLHVKIVAEDIGGDYGRTIDFYSEDGTLKIKSLGKAEKII